MWASPRRFSNRSPTSQSGCARTVFILPFGRCTWLGEGHTIGGTVGSYPSFGPDRAAVLLTENPPVGDGPTPPDLTGFSRRSGPVRFLWALVVDEETFKLARGRNARAALDHIAASGGSWVH